jgi:DNA-binding response OmpR family regulator
MANILAVASNEELVEKIKFALGKGEHSVKAFSSAGDAKNYLKTCSESLSLVIVDVGLRVFGGFEFLKYVSALPHAAESRFLVLTQKTSLDIYDLAHGTLTKPFTMRDLEKQVQFLLDC